jgi:hypothetical protein
MGAGCVGCAGGMLSSAAYRAVVVRSCAGMGTASLWSPVAGWVFARVRGVVVIVARMRSGRSSCLVLYRCVDSCSRFHLSSYS